MGDGVLRFDCDHRYPGAPGFELSAAFEIGEGVSALFGASGAGKSTCLALIAGLLRPARGRIEINGRVVAERAEKAGGTGRDVWIRPERRRLGVVFQDLLLFPHLSVRRNLLYGVRHGGAGTTPRFPLDEVARTLDLVSHLDRTPDTLSGGQRQRVALGRALLTAPDVLLLDEPLTGLDEPLKEHVVAYLERVRQRWSVPMLLVSHDQVLVRRLASHVVVLDAGRVVDQGPTGQTLDRATISSMRAHPGPVNLLRIERVEAGETHAEGVVGSQRFYLSDAPEHEPTVWVRFGAEDVALSVGDVPRLSMRNHLKGRVTEMVPIDSGKRLYIGVDVGGQRVWSQITDDAREDLALDFDAEVVCLIKAAAVRLVR